MNAFHSCDGTATLHSVKDEMTFHLSLRANICTIALITIHYLYNRAPLSLI